MEFIPNTAATMPRPINAFSEFPVVNEAYAAARAAVQERKLREDSPELGLVDVPLWRFVHSCVPDCFRLPDLSNAATRIGRRCQEWILPLLRSGELVPEEFAAKVRDRQRLEEFLTNWVSRSLGGRARGKRKPL